MLERRVDFQTITRDDAMEPDQQDRRFRQRESETARKLEASKLRSMRARRDGYRRTSGRRSNRSFRGIEKGDVGDGGETQRETLSCKKSAKCLGEEAM
ncbi:hypothetical protein E4U60_000542 [Claviceps pazoutovae]|uniref:Uncharacterized protein n=1 Tax=Claviceps pazoutovae TaxID=1649127 RepID=A0A9P7MDZ9_9HYPO|nr:hypothetical protein E4U60_000542 [Claviceps pazoutovae]